MFQVFLGEKGASFAYAICDGDLGNVKFLQGGGDSRLEPVVSRFLGSMMLPVDSVQDARPSGHIGDWVPAGGPQEGTDAQSDAWW